MASYAQNGVFPADIALQIVQTCFVEDYTTFVNCLQSCKKWNGLGRDLPWKDLHVDEHNISRVYNRLSTATSEQHRWVRSVTTELQPSIRRKELWQTTIPLFYSMLQRMPNLESFSMWDHLYDHELARPRYNLSQSKIMALPQTVRYLEIKHSRSHAFDRIFDHDLCSHIRNLLPQLHLLRIADEHVCPDFLSLNESCKELRIIEIGTMQIGRSVDWNDPARNCMQSFIDNARATIAKGHLPQLTTFSITGELRHREEVDSESTFGCLWKLDLIANSTIVYPFAMSSDSYWWMRYQAFPHTQMVDVASETEDQLRQLIEDHEWDTVGRHVRLPKILVHKRGYISYNGHPNRNITETAASYIQYRSGEKMPHILWFWENRLKRLLISVQFLRGAAVPARPRRQQSGEELEVRKRVTSYTGIWNQSF